MPCQVRPEGRHATPLRTLPAQQYRHTMIADDEWRPSYTLARSQMPQVCSVCGAMVLDTDSHTSYHLEQRAVLQQLLDTVLPSDHITAWAGTTPIAGMSESSEPRPR